MGGLVNPADGSHGEHDPRESRRVSSYLESGATKRFIALAFNDIAHMKKTALLSAVFLAGFVSFQTPVVQVRDVPNAPTIAVLAWDAASAEYGLRTRINRDGVDIGEARRGEHRLYLEPNFVEGHGGFAHAVTQDGKLLRPMSAEDDPDACRFDNVCSPSHTIGLGVPDEWLRKHRDSLVVTFRPQTGQNWTISIDGPVINAYLNTIDSISASLKKK